MHTKKQYRKTLEEMNLMDDFLMNAVASDPVTGKIFCRTLLSVLLQRNIGDITVQVQSVFQGDTTEFRGIRLDVEIVEEIGSNEECSFSNETGKAIRAKSDAFIESASCRIYDVEPQNYKVQCLPKRSRFYQAKLDSQGLESGDKDWCKLPELYVIMITNYDPFGYDYMMYTIHNKCEEIPELTYNDGLHFFYFYTDGKIGGNLQIKSLLSYLQQSIIDNVTDDATRNIHDCVETIKQSAEVRGKYMTIGEIMDFNYADGLENGRIEGRIEERTETLLSFLQDLGEISDDLKERIHSLEPDDLKVWTKLAARADTLEDFLNQI